MRTSVSQFMLILLVTTLGLTAVATSAAAQSCTGDCDGSGDVTVNELIVGVNIALGNSPVSACPVFDQDNSGEVTVDELLKAVNNALNGCQASLPWDLENPSPVGDDLFAVSFADGQHGWAVGGFADIVHTTDGGA